MPGKLKPTVSYLLGGRLATAAKSDVSASTAGGGPPPPSPPAVGLYPSTYVQPTDAEYPFCDMKDRPDQLTVSIAANWYSGEFEQGWYSYTDAGFYAQDSDACNRWRQMGGDWADQNGTMYGNAPFATYNVQSSTAVNQYLTWDVTSLVKLWVGRIYRNAGFMVQCKAGSSVTLASRWRDVATYPGQQPQLVVVTTSGTVTLTGVPSAPANTGERIEDNVCRNIEIFSTGATPAAEALTTHVSSTARTLVWFLLSQFTDPNAIVSATLKLYLLSKSGTYPNPVAVYRLINPQDPDDPTNPIDVQHAGLAANYPLDAGIEGDADVLFVQKWNKTLDDEMWIPSGAERVRKMVAGVNDGENGWQPLPGDFNSLEMIQDPATQGAGTYHWSAHRWDYPGGRLKPKPTTLTEKRAVTDELYCRYYLMFGNDWDVQTQDGKFPGFDGRYLEAPAASSHWQSAENQTVPGMGRGNSQTGADGFCGWSVRGYWDNAPRLESPTGNYRGIGNQDSYIQTGYAGIGQVYSKHYLGYVPKGQWISWEWHAKMNTVVGLDGSSAEEKPRKIAQYFVPACPMYPAGQWVSLMYIDADPVDSPTTGQALFVQLDSPEPTYGQPDSPYQTGRRWRFGGVAHYSPGSAPSSDPTKHGWYDTDTLSMGPGAARAIKVIDATHFKVPDFPGTCGTRPDATAPNYDGTPAGAAQLPPFKEYWFWAVGAGGFACCAPTEGLADGVYEAWVSGRLAYRYDTHIFRHNKWTADGSTPFGIDNIWFTLFHGGGGKPSGTYRCYWSNAVVAKSYIGPMLVPSAVPAWLSAAGNPLNTWIKVNDVPVNGSRMTTATDLQALVTARYLDSGLTMIADQWGDTSGSTSGGKAIRGGGIMSYSGGTIKKDGSEMLCFGGGGANAWAGNDVRGFRLEDDAPSWTVRVAPVDHYTLTWPRAVTHPGDPNAVSHAYKADGVTPNARHSYWQPQFIDATNTFYAIGCSNVWETDSSGFVDTPTTSSRPVDSISLDGGGWKTSKAGDHDYWPFNISTADRAIIKNQVDEMIYIPFSSSVWRFDHSGVGGRGLWQQIPIAGMPTGDFGANAYGCFDTLHNRIFLVANSSGAHQFGLIDMTARQWYDVTLTNNTTVNTASMGRFGICYDPGLDKPVLFMDDGKLYAFSYVSNTSWTLDALTVSGTPPTAGASMAHGSTPAIWSRMQYVPNLRGICIVQAAAEPVYFVRTS